MKQINRIVILSDENTTEPGIRFAELAKKLLQQRNVEVYDLKVNITENIADAVYQFDRIGLEIKPDLLMVMDFACIGMQSPEEEPLYNNMSIPVIHVLFRRPWEYHAFMVWRCNFIDRFYTLIPEDVSHIRTYYRRILNVKSLKEGLFAQDVRDVWSMEYDGKLLEQMYVTLPDYVKVLADRWRAVMDQKIVSGEEAALQRCLQEIGFVCSDAEYLDILYMMQSVFLLYHKSHDLGDQEKIVLQEAVMETVLDEFLNTGFQVSLL